MKVEKATMVACIKRIDGVDYSDKSKHFVKAYFEAGQTRRFADSLRIDAADIAAVDPNDTAHRSAGGMNAAVNAGAFPEITSAEDWKAAGGRVGAYDYPVRVRLLAMLRAKADLVGPQVLQIFENAWSLAGVDDATPEEAARAARGDDPEETDEEIAKIKLAARARELLNTPSKADLDRRDTPAYRARMK